jgi:hypothetical protein
MTRLEVADAIAHSGGSVELGLIYDPQAHHALTAVRPGRPAMNSASSVLAAAAVSSVGATTGVGAASGIGMTAAGAQNLTPRRPVVPPPRSRHGTPRFRARGPGDPPTPGLGAHVYLSHSGGAGSSTASPGRTSETILGISPTRRARHQHDYPVSHGPRWWAWEEAQEEKAEEAEKAEKAERSDKETVKRRRAGRERWCTARVILDKVDTEHTHTERDGKWALPTHTTNAPLPPTPPLFCRWPTWACARC